jgi:hypothetical protein
LPARAREHLEVGDVAPLANLDPEPFHCG